MPTAFTALGTRFLAATESIAHPDYIAALIGASANDTVITTAFGVGWPDAPHRVLRSSLETAEAASDDIMGTMKMGPMEAPVMRLSPPWPRNDTTGNIGAMSMYAGTSVDAVERRQPVAEIVAELCSLI